MRKLKVLTAVIGSLLLSACFTSAKAHVAVEEKDILKKASDLYAKTATVTVEYLHVRKDGTRETKHQENIVADRFSGLTYSVINNYATSGSTSITTWKAESWYYDNKNGTRDIYTHKADRNEDLKRLSKKVDMTLYDGLDIAGILLRDMTDGYTALSAEYAGGYAFVTGKTKEPYIASLESYADDAESRSFDWDVTLQIDTVSFEPVRAVYTRGNDLVSVTYNGFDKEFVKDVPLEEAPEELAGEDIVNADSNNE